MTNYSRVTGKVFGENATTTGDNPGIGQFGSAKAGTKLATGNIATIQALSAWSDGWEGAVVGSRNYPTLPEMTGVMKNFSQQICYLLQKGTAEYDASTTYYINDFCKVGHEYYYSLVNNNAGNNPTTSPTKWQIYSPGLGTYADQSLSNLTSDGEARLHALKGYLDEGELLTDSEGLADVKNYAHSTFDESKFEKSSGWSGTITKDGIASGFSSSNQLGVYLTFSPTKQLKYTCKFKTSSDLSSWQRIVDFTNNNTGSTLYNGIGINSSGYLAFEKGTTPLYTSNYAMSPNTEYIAELEWIYGTGYIGRIIKNGVKQEFELGIAPAMIGSNSLLNIGQRSGSAPFKGDIDLKQFSVTVDGVTIFNGNKTGIDTAKRASINAHYNGSDHWTPTLPVSYNNFNITADGVASGFSNDEYIAQSLNIGGNKLAFKIKFLTKDVTSTSRQELIRSNNFVILLGNGVSFIPRVRWGTSGDDLWTAMSDQVLQANQWYVFEGELDNTTHNWKLSLYNATTSTLLQTLPGTLSGAATLPSSNIAITIGKGSLTPFSGSIDLNSLTLYVNDDIKWQACLKIPYTESKTGSKIVDSFYRDRILDLYNQLGYAPYYTLDEVNNNFTLPMGEIYGLMQQNFETLYEGRFSIASRNSNFTIDSTTINTNGFITYKSIAEPPIKPGGFVVGTNSITIPTDGLYCITFSCQRDQNSSFENDAVRIMVNSVNKYEVSADSDYVGLTGFYYLPLFEGDLIQLYGYGLATRSGADNVITIRKINNLNIVS